MANSILSNNPTQLLTKAKVNVSDWVEFTLSVAPDFGSITGDLAKYRRVGDSMEIQFGFTAGTVGSSGGVYVELPSGFLLDTTKLNGVSKNLVGWANRLTGTLEIDATSWALSYNGVDNNRIYCVTRTESSGNYDYIEFGSNLFASGDGVTGFFTVPIQGWSSEAEFLAPLVQPKTAFIKDVKPNGTSGGDFNSGSWVTRVLNTVEGDSSFLTLSSNQFTLSAGEYLVEASAPAQRVDNHTAKLYNITDAADVIIGTTARTSSTSDLTINRSVLGGKLVIDSSKTFEIQHYCQTSRIGLVGFGGASSFGVDEVYTVVKITKLL